MNKDAFTKLVVKRLVPDSDCQNWRFVTDIRHGASVEVSSDLMECANDREKIMKLAEKEVRRELWRRLYGDISKAGQALVTELKVRISLDSPNAQNSALDAIQDFFDSFPTRP